MKNTAILSSKSLLLALVFGSLISAASAAKLPWVKQSEATEKQKSTVAQLQESLEKRHYLYWRVTLNNYGVKHDLKESTPCTQLFRYLSDLSDKGFVPAQVVLFHQYAKACSEGVLNKEEIIKTAELVVRIALSLARDFNWYLSNRVETSLMSKAYNAINKFSYDIHQDLAHVIAQCNDCGITFDQIADRVSTWASQNRSNLAKNDPIYLHGAGNDIPTNIEVMTLLGQCSPGTGHVQAVLQGGLANALKKLDLIKSWEELFENNWALLCKAS